MMGTPRSPVIQHVIRLNRGYREKYPLRPLFPRHNALSLSIITLYTASFYTLKMAFAQPMNPTPPRPGSGDGPTKIS
jgi:hypothetical protein